MKFCMVLDSLLKVFIVGVTKLGFTVADLWRHGGAESLSALVSEVEAGDTHAILHIGAMTLRRSGKTGV